MSSGAGYALMRGCSPPVTAKADSDLQMALQDLAAPGRSPLPIDAMGVRVGRWADLSRRGDADVTPHRDDRVDADVHVG
jgi:hypothetical protein